VLQKPHPRHFLSCTLRPKSSTRCVLTFKGSLVPWCLRTRPGFPINLSHSGIPPLCLCPWSLPGAVGGRGCVQAAAVLVSMLISIAIPTSGLVLVRRPLRAAVHLALLGQPAAVRAQRAHLARLLLRRQRAAGQPCAPPSPPSLLLLCCPQCTGATSAPICPNFYWTAGAHTLLHGQDVFVRAQCPCLGLKSLPLGVLSTCCSALTTDRTLRAPPTLWHAPPAPAPVSRMQGKSWPPKPRRMGHCCLRSAR